MSKIRYYLCKFGFHNYIEVMEEPNNFLFLPESWRDWAVAMLVSHLQCTRCGKKIQPEYDVFDGTDNA